MVRQRHCSNGHEFEQTPGDSEGQGILAYCSPRGYKELDMTQQLNNSSNETVGRLSFQLASSIISDPSLFLITLSVQHRPAYCKSLKEMFYKTLFHSLDITCVCMYVRAKLLQLCLTLCDSMNHSPPGSSVLGILQVRILEQVIMPFSRESSLPRDRTYVSYVSCIGR